MKRTLTKFSTLALAALSLVLWSCDNIGPHSPLSPSADASLTLTANDGAKYKLAKGKLDSKVRQDGKEISNKGGMLEAGGHRLIVPSGAVSVPTLFSMEVVPLDSDGTQKIMVRLRAYERDASGKWTVDVGPRGFLTPVRLELTYSWMTDVVSPADLRNLWVKPDGTAEVKSTVLDTSTMRVISNLNHFSDYAVGYPNAE